MKNSPLDGLRIASPCTASWDSMTGDERVRACAQCRLRVYNLSEMTKPEAESLLLKNEGRLCVRFFQRTDGTVLVKDCPVGLRALRFKAARLAASAFAAVVALFYAAVLRRPAPQPVRVHTMGEVSMQGAVLMGAPPPVMGKRGAQ